MNRKLQRKELRKQKDFMKVYEPVHENFARFCQARAYRVMSYEDLINESVLRAYQNWDNIKEKDKLLYYLFGTARNIVLNTIRKKSELSLENEMEETSIISVATNEGELSMEVEFLYEQMDKLSDTKKEALILFEISGFSIKEIAELHDSSEGAVKVMLSRARRELKKLLEDEPRHIEQSLVETMEQ